MVVDVLSLLLTYYAQREWLLLLNSTLLIGFCLFALPVFFYFLLYLCVKRSRWNVSIGGGIVLVLFTLSSWFVLINVRTPRYQGYLRGFTERAQAELDQPTVLAWADSVFTNDMVWQKSKYDLKLSEEQVPVLFTNVLVWRQGGYLVKSDTGQRVAILIGSIGGRLPYGLVLLNTNIPITHEALNFSVDYLPVGPRIHAFHGNR